MRRLAILGLFMVGFASGSANGGALEEYPWYGHVTQLSASKEAGQAKIHVCMRFERNAWSGLDESCYDRMLSSVNRAASLVQLRRPPVDTIDPQYLTCKGIYPIGVEAPGFSFFNSLLSEGWDRVAENNESIDEATYCHDINVVPPADSAYITRLLANPFPIGFFDSQSIVFDLRYRNFHGDAEVTSQTGIKLSIPVFGLGNIDSLDLSAAYMLSQGALYPPSAAPSSDCGNEWFALSSAFDCTQAWSNLKTKAASVLQARKIY